MKELVFSLSFIFSTIAIAVTPQDILKSEGFVLVKRESGKEIYYRPKEVKRYDGIVYYSTTIFYTNSANKYGLKSNYDAIGCKEKQVIRLGIHDVTPLGKSSYKNLTKKGAKGLDIKPVTQSLDKLMFNKLCK